MGAVPGGAVCRFSGAKHSEAGPLSSVRLIGLDVHKDTAVAAVAEEGSAPAEGLGSWAWDEARVLRELRKLGLLSTLKVCDEAGPTGYGLARTLMAWTSEKSAAACPFSPAVRLIAGEQCHCEG